MCKVAPDTVSFTVCVCGILDVSMVVKNEAGALSSSSAAFLTRVS